MAADAHPSFEVATIKPHDPDSRHDGIDSNGDRVVMWNQTVAKMIVFSYAVNKHQILDAPDWALNQSFDIQGKPDTPGEPSWDQMGEMMRRLLAERFGLRFHRERRELPVYALQVLNGGPKLAPAADPTSKPQEHSEGRGNWSEHTYTSSRMADFILIEQFWRDRPIVDETGLRGKYDFKLRYTYDEIRNTYPDAPPGIFTAIQQQLGLRLQPEKAPVDVFVIDHVAAPSEN
jgi:uncharacterized protein (TIGR03435 family)